MTIVFHPRYLDHQLTSEHPESPERLISVMARLEEEDLVEDLETPDAAKVDHLKLVHTDEYVEMVSNFGEGYLDPDTYNREETFDIALLAAGGGILAARRAWAKRKPTIALPRPPGHHATADSSGGFCFFNNVAIAAQFLRELGKGPEKVAIVDIDVHHGNGTNDIFYSRPDILYVSTHQWGIYPGTGFLGTVGEEDGEGFTVNIPLTSGAGDATFDMAQDGIISPVLAQFGPDIILVSIGGDAHYRDPMASLSLSSQGYLSLVDSFIKQSQELCEGRIAFFLEGGYDVDVLAEIVSATVATFHDRTVRMDYNEVMDTTGTRSDDVKSSKDVLGKFWDI